MSAGAMALRAAEYGAMNNNPSFFTGSGRDDLAGAGKGLKGKVKGLATTLILMFCVAGGGFLGFSDSLLGPALENLYTEATDVQYTSNTMRSIRIMSSVLDDTTKVTWTGGKKYTYMSPFLKSRLAKAGIDVIDVDGKKVLQFTNKAGDVVDITAAEFRNVYMNNVEFRDSFTKAKRGRILGFFDNAADKIFTHLGQTRNKLRNHQNTGDYETDEANFRDTVSKSFDTDVTDGDSYSKQYIEDTDTDPTTGETTTTVDEVPVQGSSNGSIDGGDIDAAKIAKAQNFVNGLSKVSDGTNYACAIMQIGNMISMAVAANEIYQSINYALTMIESNSKMRAGYGDESALNAVLNFFTTSAIAQVADYASVDTNTTKQGSTSKTDYITVEGAPLEASSVQFVLADAPMSPSTTTNYSLERVSKVLFGSITTAAATSQVCAGAELASSAVNVVTGIVAAIGTGGLSVAVGMFVKQAGWNLLLMGVISAALAFAIPAIAQALYTNTFEHAVGVPAGHLFTRGFSALGTRLGRSGSGFNLSTKNMAVQYGQATKTVLALDAEVDRATLSPFDITNKNTFFGSIANSLLPSTTYSNMTGVSSLVRTASSALANITGTVSAEGEGSSYMTTFGDCPDLASIGAVGDIYCNAITSSDMSTINLEPNDPTYVAAIEPHLDCSDNDTCSIIENSTLGKYISYCANRDSPFGVTDAGILQNFTTDTALGGFGSVIDAVPILGDIKGAIDAMTKIDPEAQAWASGERCVATDDPSHPNYNFWQTEGKYYQRYIEDQRILEQLGAFDEGEKNPVTDYQDRFLAAHPLDTSEAGLLAHYSGMSKDDAEFMLALIDYSNFLAEYDPENRLALDGNASALATGQKSGAEVAAIIKSEKLHFDTQNPTTPETKEPVIILSQIALYPDLRNRNYAV